MGTDLQDSYGLTAPIGPAVVSNGRGAVAGVAAATSGPNNIRLVPWR
ncbi:MAG: hypothetical protein KJ063_14805 [Anaerolineae bacterium]|nr:hypothetical protein [Anaerolineae bacterium]